MKTKTPPPLTDTIMFCTEGQKQNVGSLYCNTYYCPPNLIPDPDHVVLAIYAPMIYTAQVMAYARIQNIMHRAV